MELSRGLYVAIVLCGAGLIAGGCGRTPMDAPNWGEVVEVGCFQSGDCVPSPAAFKAGTGVATLVQDPPQQKNQFNLPEIGPGQKLELLIAVPGNQPPRFVHVLSKFLRSKAGVESSVRAFVLTQPTTLLVEVVWENPNHEQRRKFYTFDSHDLNSGESDRALSVAGLKLMVFRGDPQDLSNAKGDSLAEVITMVVSTS